MKCFAIVLLTLFSATAGWTAAPAAGVPTPAQDCASQPQVVSAVRGALKKGGQATAAGDPEASYQIYRLTAQGVLEKYPECAQIRVRLQESLERAQTMARSSDRAGEMRRSLDGILEDQGAPSIASSGGAADPISEGRSGFDGPGDDPGVAADDLTYWFSDPYFLLLELILLTVLVLIRDVRRMKRTQPPPPPLVRPFRFREIPRPAGRSGTFGTGRERTRRKV